MLSDEDLQRVGAFQCRVIVQGVTTETVTLKLPPLTEAELDAVYPYQVANFGDDVDLNITVLKKLDMSIEWLHGKKMMSTWKDKTHVRLTNVKPANAGLYEAFYSDHRAKAVHALMRLIVRSCPAGYYGDNCENECPPCYNGGICHDKWGVCICPAGFTGINCQKACGANRFGALCDKHCSTSPKSEEDGCASYTFCKPDPYGCSCATGFKGSHCFDHCEPGWYGPDCTQPCHCARGSKACNRITGYCEGGCASGWRGEACEIEDPDATAGSTILTTTMAYCPVGQFGATCEKSCHCANDTMCNMVHGKCPSGCADGWGGFSCSECAQGRFGDECEEICHCDGGPSMCQKEGFCLSVCEAGWSGFTCQQECSPGAFGRNCASKCHCLLDTDICDKITGKCAGDCEAGYMGPDCQTLCPQTLYGVNCKHHCTCYNGGHCNRIDGKCICEGKWRSNFCNESMPQIVSANDEEINVGQLVFISCTSDAIPEPEMYIGSIDFHNEFITRVLEKNQYQAVMKLAPEKSGEFNFSCSAKNVHGFASKVITLSVIDAPRLVAAPQLIAVTKESITIEWEPWKYGVDVGGKLGDVVEYMLVHREVGTSKWHQDDNWTPHTTATVENLEPYREYEVAVKCRRDNRSGEGDPGPHISVRTKCGDPLPEAIPLFFLPDEMTADFVRLTWKDPPEKHLNCKLIGYNLTYFVLEDGSSEEIRDVISTNHSNELTLYHILPNNLYTYHLYPVFTSGQSPFYAELIFRTAELIPGPVENLDYVALEEPGSLFVRWKPPSLLHNLIKLYNITYELTDRGHCGRVTSDEYLQRVFWKTTANAEVVLDNLLPYSTYFITVAARTGAGEGEEASVAAMTAESSPSNGPPNVNVSSIFSTTLEFHWDPIPCESANGIIIEYEYTISASIVDQISELPVLAKAKRDIASETQPVLKKVKGLRASVDGLQPYTMYAFAVRGYTKVDAGPFSEFVLVMTREGVPSAPQNFAVNSVAPHSMLLSWSEPLRSNGIILQYKIRYQATGGSYFDHILNTTSNNADINMYSENISNLEGGTDYVLQIQASTIAGWGDWSSQIFVLTNEDVPEKPLDVKLIEETETILHISWEPPSVTNGRITEYKISYSPLSSLDSSLNISEEFPLEVYVNGDITNTAIRGLHPSTQYSIFVQARTSAGYGPPEGLISWTTIRGDHVSPSVKTLDTEATSETIHVVFSTEGKGNVYKYQVIVEDSRNSHPIDEKLLSNYSIAVVEQALPYYIAAELDPENITDDGQQAFIVGDRKTWGGYTNVHLNPGHEYRIRIRTLVKSDGELKSVISDPKQQISMTLATTPPTPKHPQVFGFDLLLFILIASAILVAVCVITFFVTTVVCRRRERQKCKSGIFNRNSGLSESLTWNVMFKANENEDDDGPLVCEGWKYSSMIDKSSLRRSKTYAKNYQGIAVENLADYVYNTCYTLRLSEEFKQLASGQTAPWTVARKSENLKKNRYGNILPYDRYRVVLDPDPGVSDSDYINASFIDGYGRPQEYIVTQGPLECTIVDFWRMIWQKNCPVIVMLTDQVENGRIKCAKYWPEDSITSGNIHVLNIHFEECSDYVVQTLLLRKSDESRTHRVQHYRFTGWYDETVPLNAYPLLKMMERVREQNPVLSGPMVVHCSAGAGRSGTYIAIDALIQQARNEKRVDIFRFVNNARLQRINLVQTQEQYLFVHEALLEALLSEDTSIPLTQIEMHLKSMRESFTLDPKSLIRKQFQMLKHSQKKFDVSTCTTALSECNIFKNRDPMTVPADSSRVCLQSENNYSHVIEDYINAVFVDGYQCKQEYIVTQMPLQHTVEDFLALLYQTKSHLVVMLNTLDENENIGQYWPEDGYCRYGKFEVQVLMFEAVGAISVRMMKLISLSEMPSDEHKVIQLQYKAWPSFRQVPDSPASLLSLLRSVDLWYAQVDAGPITIHCMDGAVQCGLFCATSYIYKQIMYEKILNVYQAVKTIRQNRPEFISSLEQFAFCFEVAAALVNENSEEFEENLNAKMLSCNA